MPYASTRNYYGEFGKKISRYLAYRRAKKMYSEINRALNFFELKYIKGRLHHG